MSFEEQKTEIVNIARKLLADKTVDAVLSYASAGEDGRAAARFFRTADELDEMRWDEACTPNLAVYLHGKKGKYAIVAKPCDARAVAMYLSEGQIKREDVYIIGVECAGMKNSDGSAAAGCGECDIRIPPVYDVIVKSKDGIVPASEEKSEKEDHSIDRFKSELDKCILCFACRQACYGCYCKTCFVERGLPNWMPSDVNTGAKMTFHLGRAMHLAGRCVECGACERVCPSGVKIRYLIKELSGACKDLYGQTAGLDPKEPSALSTFKQDDKEAGFMGGE